MKGVDEAEVPGEDERIGLMSKGAFDSDIYGGANAAYSTFVQDDPVDEDDAPAANHPSTRASINADRGILDQGTDADNGEDPFAAYRSEVTEHFLFVS